MDNIRKIENVNYSLDSSIDRLKQMKESEGKEENNTSVPKIVFKSVDIKPVIKEEKQIDYPDGYAPNPQRIEAIRKYKAMMPGYGEPRRKR